MSNAEAEDITRDIWKIRDRVMSMDGTDCRQELADLCDVLRQLVSALKETP